MSDFDVDAFIEYHVGDCSCEHGHECQSCTMKHELKKEIKELRTRVAELEKENQKYKQFEERYAKIMERFDLIYAHELIDTLDCLEARADDLEAWRKKAIESESKLSTLLKASEGMEKALEESNELASLYAYDFRARLQHPRNQAEIDGNFETIEKAKQALADFRAVKETMAKGARK